MIRYLITAGDAAAGEQRWLRHLAAWIERGVDFIQIRERDLSARRLAELTRKVIDLRGRAATKILVNDRADVATACDADGIHLRDDSPDVSLFRPQGKFISIACHSIEHLPRIKADLVLLAPVFSPLSKESHASPLGLAAITHAVRLTKVPILALGGVSNANEEQCVKAGATGIAGISYFSELIPAEPGPSEL